MDLFLKKANQRKALEIIEKYGIISPIILVQSIKINEEQANKLIDFLFIQGFIHSNEKNSSEEIIPTGCQNGCEGCPFKTISACSGSSSEKRFFLTEKAKKMLQSRD